MKQKIKLLFGILGMLALILDSRLALSAASEGIEICLRAVIPSLFPFFFFSGLLTDGIKNVRLPFSSILGHMIRLPPEAVSFFLIGILGGYPVGAQTIGQAVSNGSLPPSDGRRTLPFCNNCGPAFIFGIVAAVFDTPWMPVTLWIIQIISAVICAQIIPGHAETITFENYDTPATVILKKSLIVMGQVCSWILLFRVLLAFITHWFGFMLSPIPLAVLSGLLELSNGCFALSSITHIPLRFILCSGMLSFGGICVTLQTFSVCPPNLKTDLYIPVKVLQGCCSILLSSLLMAAVYRYISVGLLLVNVVLTAFCVIFLGFFKKRSRFLQSVSI